MTTPSIKFVCPKCGSVKYGITSDILMYCNCVSGTQTVRRWSGGPVDKVRARKIKTQVRMMAVNK